MEVAVATSTVVPRRGCERRPRLVDLVDPIDLSPCRLHVSSIQPMHGLDSGDRMDVRLSSESATRGKGACGTRLQVFGR